MTLEQLRILVKVAHAGSFTRAADVLGQQKSHLSRVVSQLEAELGVKLLERTTRRLSMTETGREVVARAGAILGAVDDTIDFVHEAQGEPRGVLRVTCGVEFGMLAVGRWVGEYLTSHPQASVDVEYTSRVIDLVHEGFDVAIRVGAVAESRLVARSLGSLEYGLFACPRYLARRGAVDDPADLRAHDLVMFSQGVHRKGWVLVPEGVAARDVRRIEGPARLRVNNSFAVREALLASLGVGQLPLLIAAEEVRARRLVPVLPGWRPQGAAVHAVFPSNRYLSPKVRAFVDLAVRRFPLDTSAARRDAACVEPAMAGATSG